MMNGESCWGALKRHQDSAVNKCKNEKKKMLRVTLDRINLGLSKSHSDVIEIEGGRGEGRGWNQYIGMWWDD